MKFAKTGLLAVATCAFCFAVRAAAPATGLIVDITAPANHSRLRWQSRASYAVTASYDGKSTKFGELPSTDILLRASFAANADAPPPAAALPDALLAISRSNCTGCHDFTAASSAPSFAAIGKRYSGQAAAVAMLAEHIRSGSRGTWGRGTMPPHPDMTAAEATAIAEWIASDGNDAAVQYVIGRSGSFRMSAAGKAGPHSGMVLSAFYTGPLKAGESRRPAAGRSTILVYGTGS